MSRLFSLGYWDCWLDRDTGSELYTFTIITTRANALLRPIHDRMPVIYDPAMGRQWLEGPFGGSVKIFLAVLQPLRSELMEAHEVSTMVNSPENDTAACIQPVSPSQPSSAVRLITTSQNKLSVPNDNSYDSRSIGSKLIRDTLCAISAQIAIS